LLHRKGGQSVASRSAGEENAYLAALPVFWGIKPGHDFAITNKSDSLIYSDDFNVAGVGESTP
jgi:hypothetical protein